MFLFIDTSQKEEMIIALVKLNAEVLDKMVFKVKQNHSEKLLPAIEKILRKNQLRLKGLQGIGVVRGPGSFTGVRVGVACANTFGFSLNIPVKGVKYKNGVNLIKLIFRDFKGGEFSKSVVPYYRCKAV